MTPLRRPRSLRARLTLWYTLVLGAPLVAFAGASFLVLDRALVHRADTFLDEALGAFINELRSEQREEHTTATAVASSLKDVRFRELPLAVFDSAGTLYQASPVDSAAEYTRTHPLDLGRVGIAVHEHATRARVTFNVGAGVSAYRIAAEPVAIFGVPYLAAAAFPLHGDRETMDRVAIAYLVAIPLLLLAAAAGGWFLAGRSLAPVAAMSARAAEITARNLNERLPVGERDDELSRLADVVNGLLERLERAFAQQRRFMADASHELRTPVAVLRTEADVTLAQPHRTEEDYRESVVVMRDAARRLGRIVDDLFLLARADAGHLPIRRESLYLEEVVDDAARAVRAIAQERGVRIELLPLEDSPFEGDADLLGRLLLNLLDNAIKHSPEDGTVTLSLSRRGDAYNIDVVDEGPGIPPDAQTQIFERFFRVDRTRSRGEADRSGGAGLGLAIARWIAEAHGGHVELVRSDERGSEFRVVLPAPADARARTAAADGAAAVDALDVPLTAHDS